MDEGTSSVNHLQSNGTNYSTATPEKNLVNDQNVNNNAMNSSEDENVFSTPAADHKKQLNLHEAFNSPNNLSSPSRQQVIGDVINEVISDHLNGDNPIPRMVPLDDRVDKEEGDNQLHGVSSEKKVDTVVNEELNGNGVDELKDIERKDSSNTATEVENESSSNSVEELKDNNVNPNTNLNTVNGNRNENAVQNHSEDIGVAGHQELEGQQTDDTDPKTISNNTLSKDDSVEKEVVVPNSQKVVQQQQYKAVPSSVETISDDVQTHAPDDVDNQKADSDVLEISLESQRAVDESKQSEENGFIVIDTAGRADGFVEPAAQATGKVDKETTRDTVISAVGNSEQDVDAQTIEEKSVQNSSSVQESSDLNQIDTDITQQTDVVSESTEKNTENTVASEVSEMPQEVIVNIQESVAKTNEVTPALESETVEEETSLENTTVEESATVDKNITSSTEEHNQGLVTEVTTPSPTSEESKDSVTENITSQLEDTTETATDIVKADGEKEETEIIEPEWLDILGNGLLKKKVLKKGLGRESRAIQGDLVSLRCEGKLADGTVVDKNSHLQMILGDADVMQAIDMCVALMEDKETCILNTDARYAYSIYGRLDYKPAIPQNAHLTFELEVLSIERGKPPMEMTTEECVLRSDKKRVRGNDLYSRGNHAGAIDAYKRGLKYLEGRKEKESLDMKIKCLNNLSAAQLKVKAYMMALQSLEVVLQLEPKNVKAIFRKSKCLEGLGKEGDAFECMKKASVLDPSNKLIMQDLGRLQSRVSATQKKEKEIYQRMFSKKKQEEQEEGGEEGGEHAEDDDNEDEDEDDVSILPLVGAAIVAGAAALGGLYWYKYR